MHLSNPASEFLSGAVIEVLTVLNRAKPKLTGRSIAQMCDGVSYSQANLILRKLENLGIVSVESIPPSKLYTLNRENFGTIALLGLLNQFDQAVAQAEKGISNWREKPLAVWLFGSAALGKADTNSDIDIALIWSKANWEVEPVASQIEELSSWLFEATGNEANLLNISMSELKTMLQNKAALVGQLRRDAKVVWGATPEDLLAKI